MKYYKGVFSLFFISVFFWHIFYVSLTYAYYYIDQSGFIEQFCENIDKPEMECNGKCHLKNIVEKKTSNEKTPINLIVQEEITLFFDHLNNLDLVLNIIEKREKNEYYFNFYSYSKEYSLYHPPQV